MSDTSVEARSKASTVAMKRLVTFIQNNTGAFGDHANESVTVMVGGRKMKYSPRWDDIVYGKDPVMTHVQDSPEYHIYRISTFKASGAGYSDFAPALHIEVVEDASE